MTGIGMAGVMHGCARMMRKVFATVALLLITGVFPAMASLGFCATEPCCRSHEKDGVELGTHLPCCNEMSCSTSAARPAELARQTKNVHASTLELPIVACAELV